MRLYVHVEGNVKYTGTAAAMDDDDTGTFTFTCCFRHNCSWTGLDRRQGVTQALSQPSQVLTKVGTADTTAG